MREPSDAEVLRAAMNAAVKTVMTTLPGKVVSYNPTTKRATIEPMVHNGNPLQPIPDVPVKWPRFGGYRFVGPLNPGDEVTLHFHQLDPTRFRVSGDKSEANLLRPCGIYPIAVPGSESETSTYDGGGDALLHIGTDNADTEIKLGANAVTIKAATVNLTVDAPTDAAALASKVDSLFSSLRAAISSAFMAVGAGAAANGATGASKFETDFPAPTSVASAKVKLN